MTKLTCVLLGAGLLFGSAPALAAPTAEDIKAAGDEFDRGRRAFKDRDWVTAAEAAEAADRRAPAAAALELAIRARERAKQLDRAAILAALALDRHASDTKLVALARPIVERAARNLHALSVSCVPACDLVSGTTLVHGGAAEKRTLYLAAGTHEVRASWSGGRSVSETVKAEKGGQSELSLKAPPEEKPAPAVEPGAMKPPAPAKPAARAPVAEDSTTTLSTTSPPSGLPPGVFFVGAGLTVVAAGFTVWSGLDTRNNPGVDRVRSECAGLGTECETYQDGLSRQRRTNIALGVTAGLGVVTAVVGGFMTNWSGSDTRAALPVEPLLVVGDGATLGARGSF